MSLEKRSNAIIPGVSVLTQDYKGRKYSDYYVGRESIGKGWYVFGRNSTDYGVKADGKGALVSLVAYPDLPARKLPKISRLVQVGFRTKGDAQLVADELNAGGSSRTIPMLNPIIPARGKKRAAPARKRIARVGVSQKRYVSRPSQAGGVAPSKRLKARRRVANKRGYFPNPSVKVGDYVRFTNSVVKQTGHSKDVADMRGEIVGIVAGGKVARVDTFGSFPNEEGATVRSIPVANLEKTIRKNPRNVRPLLNNHHVLIPLAGKKTHGVGPGFKTQTEAMKRAESLSAASGLTHGVASRAWIERRLKA